MKAARVIMVKRLAKDTYSIRVEPLNSIIERVDPFNFFMVWIPRIDELPLCVADADDATYTFVFKVKGSGTRALSGLAPNQFIGLKGPIGRGFLIDDSTKKVLVIAGGIGIAPVPLFIKRSRCKRIDVIWGVRSEDELFNLDNIFPEITGKYTLTITTEDCSCGVCGTVLDALNGVDLDYYDSVVAIGPKLMIQRLCEYIASDKVYVALETMVKCGIGACGSCYIKSSTKLLCVEGPVFRCGEVREHLKTGLNS